MDVPQPTPDRPKTDAEKVRDALNILWENGQVEGAHHKTWVIDQLLRALTDDGGPKYDGWAHEWEHPWNEDVDYRWERGIAP